MKAIVKILGSAVLFATLAASGQEAPKGGTAPIFHVNVLQSTVSAINYQYRNGPTTIDFKGTILMPDTKGHATVESRRGRTEIDASLEHMLPPQRFGREYLTYTLWAITPEGGVRNIAEIVPGPSNKASVHVSTDLQAFGLIVTAEPYSAARQPSNVVVLENQVRPDTAGKIEQVQARYELMPRGQYTWRGPEQPGPDVANAPKVSMDRYEAILEVYEAQNALGIARAANAEKYAAPTLARAQQLYDAARRLETNKGSNREIVENARESAQTAEDARAIAERKQQEEKIANAQAAVAAAQQAQARAEEEARRANAEAEAARTRADAERAAREQAEAEVAAARASAAQFQGSAQEPAAAAESRAAAPPVQAQAPQQQRTQPQSGQQQAQQEPSPQESLRTTMLQSLSNLLPARDTGRGLVATLTDADFDGPEPMPEISGLLERVAAIVKEHPGLHVDVEGNTDSDETQALSFERANAVRNLLIAQGLPDGSVKARGLGDSHPLGPNTSPAGREANRRVEMVISGEPVGNHAAWDHSYALIPGQE